MNWSSLAWVIAWHLLDIKPSPKPMQTYCQVNQYEQNLRDFNQNSKLFQENSFDNVTCKMSTILFRHQCVRGDSTWLWSWIQFSPSQDVSHFFTALNITVMLHECQVFVNHWCLVYYLFNSLFRLMTKETPKLHITGPLWGESITDSDWRILFTKGQKLVKCFHV